ncbi:hypothetical protein TNCV_4505451 [Trichonephila clavipes]|nr:hypothetical protein TNCV_4505451 [Trichonephila clavipes]
MQLPLPSHAFPNEFKLIKHTGCPGSLEQTLKEGREHHKNLDLYSNPWSEMSSFRARWRYLQDYSEEIDLYYGSHLSNHHPQRNMEHFTYTELANMHLI